ncbi:MULTISPECIES: helix-turn-helix transcriptional regulator [Halomonas]|uniref:Transcriptional regulator n=1 Tax=Halomonas halophila TaxID=29573 RepID=A0ABQ0U060_9GAMM|nr:MULTISPECIES: helix-turn-helix transcriptional regulator [Halomonas]MDR5888347.1 helix-turn-helix transcriptional regulator [Halomonas salina]WJY08857.1 helix-turn-helix transcriptional regulator [Halomonas halophila]GEK71786.1 transcriptional regulator [Halomonas halophila]
MKPQARSPQARQAALLEQLRLLMRGETTEGRVLRTLRREVLGLTQTAYAELVGVSRRTLSDIERDAGNASMASLDRVFRPLGLKVGLMPRQPELLAELLG